MQITKIFVYNSLKMYKKLYRQGINLLRLTEEAKLMIITGSRDIRNICGKFRRIL